MNPFLYKKTTVINSFQIIRYLQFYKVQLNDSLLLYTIHSKNPELVHFLEENCVIQFDQSFNEVLQEAIICHHNNIANCIIDNLNKNELVEALGPCNCTFLCKGSFNVSEFIIIGKNYEDKKVVNQNYTKSIEY